MSKYRKKNGRWLQMEAVMLTISIRLGLKFLPFITVHRTLTSFAEQRVTNAAESNESLARIIGAVDAASQRVPGATCLVQAYALHISLARRGIPTSIRIGVQRNHAHQLYAHAWVEQDGRVLIGNVPDLSFYAVLSFLGE